MLNKPASFVLASLSGSRYEKQYASPLRLLRRCWTAFLDIRRVPVLGVSVSPLVGTEGS